MPRPPGLIECDHIADIGAGIRPINWYTPKRHLCIEPHKPYADILRSAGYEVQLLTAAAWLAVTEPVDAIYMLDVIEHMEKDAGLKVLSMAAERARYQVVVYTPSGFVEQTHDAWGMGGEYWQTHRSGWTPEEFRGWEITKHGVGFQAVLTHR